MISRVQPLTPYLPTTGVMVANMVAGFRPTTPTTVAISSTTPTLTLSEFNSVRQLPAQTIGVMASQQAVTSASLSAAEKLEAGIVEGAAGCTLAQLSMPGQYVKPGAGEFARQLMQANPGIPFNKTASSVLMTGLGGVKTPENLIANTNAQLGAVANSITNATTALTNNGILTGKESPTQIGGVVMAAATLGVGVVTDALKNPLAVAGAIGGTIGKIGSAIASGNFAAGLADKVKSGVSGIAASLGSVASGALGALSSGIGGLAGLATGGLNSILSGVGGMMQSAFAMAEQSFGKLNAGVPNSLGGLPDAVETPMSKTLSFVRDHQIASDELNAAQKELKQAKKAFSVEESAETYEALRAAEAKVASSSQKVAAASKGIIEGADAVDAASGVGNALGAFSAQKLSATANAAVSGLLNAPNTINTGINAIPGGIGAFANQVGSVAGNIISSAKNAAQNLVSSIPGALGALADPSKLVGNLVSNVSKSLGGIANSITKGLSGVTNAIGGALGSAKNALGALKSAASAGVGGLLSNITSALSSLGNAPGQIKAAILAVDTFPEKAAIASTLNSALDPKVPPPSFDEVLPSFEPEPYQEAQVAAQQNLVEKLSEREFTAYNLSQLVEKFDQSGDLGVLEEIERVRANLDAIDVQIVEAQETYSRLTGA